MRTNNPFRFLVLSSWKKTFSNSLNVNWRDGIFHNHEYFVQTSSQWIVEKRISICTTDHAQLNRNHVVCEAWKDRSSLYVKQRFIVCVLPVIRNRNHACVAFHIIDHHSIGGNTFIVAGLFGGSSWLDMTTISEVKHPIGIQFVNSQSRWGYRATGGRMENRHALSGLVTCHHNRHKSN